MTQIIDELTDRGYNAVRIDAYPHLVSKDVNRVWTLEPVWFTQMWGAASVTRVCLKDHFRGFLRLCRKHHVRVALSTWFRQDVDHSEMEIKTPEDHAEIWKKTLDLINEWGELDNILYVDLCNEFTLNLWSPFLRRETSADSEFSINWMKRAVSALKRSYPDMPMTFSFTFGDYNTDMDVSYLDFLEPHIWMTNQSDFYQKIGYDYNLFDFKGYRNVALYAEEEYRGNKEKYVAALLKGIDDLAGWAKRSKKPLITTECWAITDYKDGPLLNWGWVLELNRIGVEAAIATGCFAAVATSNFCGPQFAGMWREKLWHKDLTEKIKNSSMI